MDQLKQIACDAIDKELDNLRDLSNEIWHHKELAYEEHKSHETLTKFLSDRGFYVEPHYKLETAFVARWGSSEGGKPHIAVLCEYDALSEIGHACGHNLIAELGVAAGLGIKAAMEHAGMELGKLSVIGTPAEEGGGGKVKMIIAGAFDGVDVALMSHPAPLTNARPIFLSTRRLFVSYHGRSSHAAGFPWEGVNALDAAVLGYMNIAALRQQLKPMWKVHSIITKGGTAINVIPGEAEMKIQARAPTDSELEELVAKIKMCLTASATATGCTVDINEPNVVYECMITNETLATLYETNGKMAGVDFSSSNAHKEYVLGSTDMGNVSHRIPSLHPLYDCNTRACNHTTDFTVAAGSLDAQPSTIAQGKTLAMVALDVFQNPQILDSIKRDFENDMKHL